MAMLIFLNLVSLMVGYSYFQKEESPNFWKITWRVLLIHVAVLLGYMLVFYVFGIQTSTPAPIEISPIPPLSGFGDLIAFLIALGIALAFLGAIWFTLAVFVPYVVLYILNDFKWKKKISYNLL